MTAAEDAIVVETPEGVRFALPLAGIVTRFLAWVVDAMAISTISGTIGKVFSLVEWVSADGALALSAIAYFAISIGYGIAFEWFWHGQTLGKRILSLRVMDANALKLQFSQIVLRNLMRCLDSLPGLYLIGGAAASLTDRRQRLGDLVANTVVVRQRKLTVPDLLRLDLDAKFNSLTAVPHLAARLRQQISPALLELAYQALLRRTEFTPEVKLEVFRLLADRFRGLVKFPDEITIALTDERYVRNALQIALSKPGQIDPAHFRVFAKSEN